MSKWLPLTHAELLRWEAQQVRITQDNYEVKDNKEKITMTNNEYEYIIEQQKEIIKQQKDLIDKLIMRVNQIVIPIEKDKQVSDYTKYPTITWSHVNSTDTKGE